MQVCDLLGQTVLENRRSSSSRDNDEVVILMAGTMECHANFEDPNTRLKLCYHLWQMWRHPVPSSPGPDPDDTAPGPDPGPGTPPDSASTFAAAALFVRTGCTLPEVCLHYRLNLASQLQDEEMATPAEGLEVTE